MPLELIIIISTRSSSPHGQAPTPGAPGDGWILRPYETVDLCAVPASHLEPEGPYWCSNGSKKKEGNVRRWWWDFVERIKSTVIYSQNSLSRFHSHTCLRCLHPILAYPLDGRKPLSSSHFGSFRQKRAEMNRNYQMKKPFAVRACVFMAETEINAEGAEGGTGDWTNQKKNLIIFPTLPSPPVERKLINWASPRVKKGCRPEPIT